MPNLLPAPATILVVIWPGREFNSSSLCFWASSYCCF